MLVWKRHAHALREGNQAAEAAQAAQATSTAGAAEPPGAEPARPAPDLAEGLRTHGVSLGAALLIVIQLLWMVDLLTHSYFRQDDYSYLYRGLESGFGWKYLTWEDAGQLMPFGMAVSWALARVSLYSWLLASVSTLVLLTGTSLAMLRMLRTLFGNRPAILAVLAVFLFSPLQLAGISWWSWAIIILPVELTFCMAVTAHVHYLRDGRARHAIAAAGWLLLGMAASDKGAVVPLVLFALTSAFFVPGTWAAAAVKSAVRYWRAWLLYGSVLAAWAAVYLVQLSSSAVKPAASGSISGILSFVSTLTGTVLLPGAVGGPWQWAQPGYAVADPPAALQQLSWAVCAIVLVVSCARRVRAWRAWAILAGWVAVADILPIVLGRMGQLPASLLGTEARYLEDAVPVLALCAGLAFLPLADEQGAIRFRLPAARPAVAVLLSVCVIGSFWSLQSFETGNVVPAAAARSYIVTAQAAVAGAPRGALIVDGPTPASVMAPIIFGSSGYTSRVIGAIARGEPAKHLAWTAVPRGAVGKLMVFNASGQLLPAAVAGPVSGPPPVKLPVQTSRKKPGKEPRKKPGKTSGKTPGKTAGPHCWAVTTAGISIPVHGSLYRWNWFVRLDYSGPATAAAVSYGGGWASVQLPAGTHSFYVPVVGGGSTVGVRLAAPSPGWCLTGLAVGSLQPAPSGPAIPATPLTG
ncbi:MAG TPA: hypothetical protein VIP48_14790 [Streptosporangiaceae bacterium]